MASPSRFLPTGDWVRALLAPALVFIATALNRSYQTDFWHHLSRGRAIAESGTLLNTDQFTYTVAGQSFQDSNWLPQLLYWSLFEHGGLALVQTINSLVLALVMGGLVYLCWRRSASVLLAGALTVFAFFGTWQLLIIRPQTFSLLLFVLLYGTLEMAAGSTPQTPRSRWGLVVPPVILALWANVHGGFPVGLILVGCYVLAAGFQSLIASVGENVPRSLWSRIRAVLVAVWPWLLCLTVCLAATCVNPYGWKIYQYVGVTSATASARRIDEWVPPGLDLLVGRMWVVSVVAVVLLFALPRRRPTVREICLVLVFLPLACGSVRMVTWWFLIIAPIAAALIVDNLPKAKTTVPEKPSWAAAGCVVLLLLGMTLSAPVLEAYNPLLGTIRSNHRDEDDLSQVATELAVLNAASPAPEPRRIFSRFEWGEYLGWALQRHGYTIFMDARIEIYPDDVWDQYMAVTQGRGDWEDILTAHRVDYLLLDSSYHGQGLLPLVEKAEARWQKIFHEGKAVLFVRKTEGRESPGVSGGPAAED